MDRTLRVTGKGSLSIAPDTIELLITLDGKDFQYEKALELSAKTTSALRAALEDAGFDGKELKTTSFNVNTEYESYQDENRNYCSRFAGYSFYHGMKISFAADNSLLGKALAAVSSCGANPRFEINYTVKDKESAKNELLKKAVADSKKKAELLAEAAGVKLKEIASIDYSWGSIEILSRPVTMKAAPLMAKAAAPEMDIEPENIDVSDTVTVVWKLD